MFCDSLAIIVTSTKLWIDKISVIANYKGNFVGCGGELLYLWGN